MRRFSVFHNSLNRPQLYAGIPMPAFMVIVLGGSFCFVAKLYMAMPALLVLWFLARWLTKRDTAWMDIFERYLKEGHVYDTLPRVSVCQSRPNGWGKGLPW